MSLRHLLELLPPPAKPVDVPSPAQWMAIQAKLGRLPADYVGFIDRYGSGIIDDFLSIYNPAAANPYSNLAFQVGAVLGGLEESNAQQGVSRVPVFPAPGGLLPFGGTENGDGLYWDTTAEDPDEWTVTLMPAREMIRRDFPSPLTSTLAGLLDGSIDAGAAFPLERSFRPSELADLSAYFQEGRFIRGTMAFSGRLDRFLQSLPWNWNTWYWMPPQPDWLSVGKFGYFRFEKAGDPAAVDSFLEESGFGRCAAAAVLYDAGRPAVILPPKLLVPHLHEILKEYGGVRFIFGCSALSSEPEIVPGVFAQFGRENLLRFTIPPES